MNPELSGFEKLTIGSLADIAPSRITLFKNELGITTVYDLLNHIPNRYLDKSTTTRIADIQTDGVSVQVVGRIESMEIVGVKKGRRLKAVLCDNSGCMELVWFQSISWIKKYINIGETYTVFGKVKEFKGTVSISHPEMSKFDPNKPVEKLGFEPIYPMTERLKAARVDSKNIAALVKLALTHVNFDMPEFLPEEVIKRLKLVGRKETYRMIHFPNDSEEVTKALERLKFEEMFLFQLRTEFTRQNRISTSIGPKITKTGFFFNELYSKYLPFELTGAQKKVIKEIWNDMKSGTQMNRLLQGDVGSGKTMVAFISLLLVIDNGYQTCMLAPTEILTQQNYESLKELASKIGLRVEILTGSTSNKERDEILKELAEGKISLLVGTHAILEDRVVFKNLGLAIIDEQHRFGVAQRSKLWLKANPAPHILLMTATPIPRTLAMTIHGESDHSVIDEMPAGRKPVTTLHKDDSERIAVMSFIKREIEKGRQIYFVFPLIDHSEVLDLKNLMDGYDMVTGFFPTPEYRISIVHGQMKPEEKEKEMARFKNGVSHIMVATTVIEVGVNVPNASVMVIESAERFGLSQLHQLRGRVGRGSEQSFCILMTKSELNRTARERMEAMVRHTDGFEIAKIDLHQRGPGDMLGTKQSGLPDFKFIDFVKDEYSIFMGKNAAAFVLKNDPMLRKPENALLRNYLLNHNSDNFWSKIS